MDEKLKNKISEAMEESFIGNYIFDANELESIYEYVSYTFRKLNDERGLTLSISDYDIVFVALVNLMKQWNPNDENFLNFIYRNLLSKNDDYLKTQKTYKQITIVIDNLDKSKKIFTLAHGKKYYATICSHAFAPINSIESFFDMCWEIYCEDLNQQYDTTDLAFKLIADSLQNKFANNISDEEKDFQIGSKIYSFRIGIKGLVLYQEDKLIRLLNTTISTINSLFNNEPIKLDKYIKVLINNWWKKKDFGIIKERCKTKTEKIVNDYSKIRPKYILESAVAKLIIPPIRLFNNYEYEPYIEIKVDGQSKICDKMLTSGSGVLMATRQIEYELNKFSSLNIEVEISHCDKVIYKSHNSLVRDFILFNDSREILSQDCLPGRYFLYSKKLSDLLQYPNDTCPTNINTYFICSLDGEVVQSQKKTIFFNNQKEDRELYFFANQKNDIIYRMDDEEYKVIDGELYVDVNTDVDIRNYGVRYKEASFKLSEFNCEYISDKNRYCVSSILDVCEPQRIVIFKYSDNTIICSINLIKFNNISVNFDKELYYGKNEVGIVNFSTNKYNYEEIFSIKQNEVSIQIEKGEIIVFPPILKWKIDNREWRTEPIENGIWYENFTNSSIITICSPKNTNCSLCLNNQFVERSDANKFKIGQTLYSEKEKTSLGELNLFIKTGDNNSYKLTTVHLNETFLNDPMQINSLKKEICWYPENFIGNPNAYLRLDIRHNEKVINSKSLNLEKSIFDFSELVEDYYSLRITLSKGFIKKEKILFEKKFIFGNEKAIKYKNKFLEITEIIPLNKSIKKRIQPVCIDNIKFLGTRDNYDYYFGSIFIVGRDGRKNYLNYMKDESGNFVKINPIRIELKNEHSCYIGYGLDLDDADFEYDDEFVIDSEGKTTIGNIYRDSHSTSIDYFLFEVREHV